MKISAKGVSSSQPRGYIQRWSLQYTPQTRLGWLFDSMACQRQSVSHQSIYSFFSAANYYSQNQRISLKIMTADSPASRELQSIKHIEKHSQCSLSSNYIVHTS